MKLLSRLARHLPPSWQSDATILLHRPIPDALWAQTLSAFPFLTWRDAVAQKRLRELSTLFLARKQFTPVNGLLLTDEVAVAIAAQACLPIMRWGLNAYDSFMGIVVHPDQVLAHREYMDDHGVVHHFEEVLAGEAMPGGPVMLSWQDVQQAGNAEGFGYNVVVHEFAHALDMRSNGGEPTGVPPLPPGMSSAHWQDVLWQAFDRHSEALARGESTWLDPYAATDGLVEFFPVVTEVFFTAPQALRRDFNAVYELLSAYFGEDPASFEAFSPSA